MVVDQIRRMFLAVLFLLVACAAQAGDTPELDTNNVVVVLDASGSMDNKMRSRGIRKMDAAKTALLEVLRNVAPNTHVGLLVFSARGVTDPWLYPLGPVDAKKLEERIRLPEPGGSTPLGRYIKRGADALLAQRKTQHGYGTYRLLVVTDGEATDANLVERYTPEVISRGITVDVIGVDMASAHTLATRVHSYRSANDPESLKKAVADVFAEVGGSSSGGADQDAFSQLAPIPGEMAQEILLALASSGNAPIGEELRPAKNSTSSSVPIQTAKAVTPSTSKPVTPQKNIAREIVKYFFLFVALIIIASKLGKRNGD